MSKLEAFADDKLNDAKMMISVCEWVENIVRKKKNAGYEHFLLFPPCFCFFLSFLQNVRYGVTVGL